MSPDQEKAEQLARRHGYRGVWPPPPRPRIDDAASLQAELDKLSAGELRSACVAAAGDHLAQFFAGLSPEHFRDFGRMLVRAILWDELPADERRESGWGAAGAPTPRVQIRAVQAALKPMLQVIGLVPKLARLKGLPTAMLAHLLTCTHGFLAPFGGDVMPRVAARLFRLATAAASADTAVRAAGAAATLTLTTLETLVSSKLGLEQANAPVDDAALARARADFEAMAAQARADLARGRAAAQTAQPVEVGAC